MAEYGHSKTSRKAFLPLEEGGDPFWHKSRVFSEWEAWEYLFAFEAGYGDHAWALRGGTVITLQRGETRPLSIRYLEQRWRWGKNRVHRFIAALIQMDRIVGQQRTPDGDTYLVVNYDKYQGERDSGGTANGTAAGQRRDSGGTKQKQGKQGKQGRDARKLPIPSDWNPTSEHSAYCAENLVDIAAEAEKFRFWAESKSELRSNWNATFSGWVRRDWVKRLNGTGRETPAKIWDESIKGPMR